MLTLLRVHLRYQSYCDVFRFYGVNSAYYEWITEKLCLPVPFCIFYLQIVVNLNLISRVYMKSCRGESYCCSGAG